MEKSLDILEVVNAKIEPTKFQEMNSDNKDCIPKNIKKPGHTTQNATDDNCKEKHKVSVTNEAASSMSQLKEIGHCGHYVFTLSDLTNTFTCL